MILLWKTLRNIYTIDFRRYVWLRSLNKNASKKKIGNALTQGE